jgi:hypothetical protein
MSGLLLDARDLADLILFQYGILRTLEPTHATQHENADFVDQL